jgi:hypothetical protein
MPPRSDLPRQSTLPVALALIATSFSDPISDSSGSRKGDDNRNATVHLVSPFVTLRP